MTTNLRKKYDYTPKFQRKRNFKGRMPSNAEVTYSNKSLAIPSRHGVIGLKAKHAGRLRFKTFFGAESALWPTKKKVTFGFTQYPNFFVKKRSKGARMGKSVPKIAGKIMRFKRGQVLISLACANPAKNWKWVQNVRRVFPVKLLFTIKDKDIHKVSSLLWIQKYFRKYKLKYSRRAGMPIRKKKNVAQTIVKADFYNGVAFMDGFDDVTYLRKLPRTSKRWRSTSWGLVYSGAMQMVNHYKNKTGLCTTYKSLVYDAAAPVGGAFKSSMNFCSGRYYRRLVIDVPKRKKLAMIGIERQKRLSKGGELMYGLLSYIQRGFNRTARPV